MDILRELRQALLLCLTLLAVCGVGYPYAVTGVSAVLFPQQAGGSIISINGKSLGSAIVGQNFTDPRFMRGRPSAVNYNVYAQTDTTNGLYAGLASGSTNLGPSNPLLAQRVQKDMAFFLATGVTARDIPTDLATASGSGLDPHISPAAAAVQLPKISVHTGLPHAELERIVLRNTAGKVLGIFGEERVLVLGVNLEIARAIGFMDLQ